MKEKKTKVRGEVLAEIDGLTITASPADAKRAGKNRLWIQIRQTSPKKWRISECLAYARSLDVQFVEDQED